MPVRVLEAGIVEDPRQDVLHDSSACAARRPIGSPLNELLAVVVQRWFAVEVGHRLFVERPPEFALEGSREPREQRRAIDVGTRRLRLGRDRAGRFRYDERSARWRYRARSARYLNRPDPPCRRRLQTAPASRAAPRRPTPRFGRRCGPADRRPGGGEPCDIRDAAPEFSLALTRRAWRVCGV